MKFDEIERLDEGKDYDKLLKEVRKITSEAVKFGNAEGLTKLQGALKNKVAIGTITKSELGWILDGVAVTLKKISEKYKRVSDQIKKDSEPKK